MRDRGRREGDVATQTLAEHLKRAQKTPNQLPIFEKKVNDPNRYSIPAPLTPRRNTNMYRVCTAVSELTQARKPSKTLHGLNITRIASSASQHKRDLFPWVPCKPTECASRSDGQFRPFFQHFDVLVLEPATRKHSI